MTTIEVFEATPSVKSPAEQGEDFICHEFNSRLRWLQAMGVSVQRYALPQDSSRLPVNPAVKSAFEAQGPDCLPIVVVNEDIVSVAGYPTPIELMEATGRSAETDPEFLRTIAGESAALGAAIAANDLQGFRDQWKRLRWLGISQTEANRVVQSAIEKSGSAVRDNMRTGLEQFLAFGPQGKPPKPRCSCGNNT